VIDEPDVAYDVDAGPQEERLTEAQLEALLFVAERPLSRREIAAIARVDRVTVDERLGDLEVALANRGIRLILSDDRVELVTAPASRRRLSRPSRSSPTASR
jgi:chromosome segregation and condensation protein ScpB